MRLLLDTSVFLWFITGDRRLPEPVCNAIAAPSSRVSLSVVSLWEVQIKQALGRLPLPEPAGSYIPRQRERHGIEALALVEDAVGHLAKLPDHHRDPFDRMLICQAIEHDLRLVSADQAIHAYPVRLFWPGT